MVKSNTGGGFPADDVLADPTLVAPTSSSRSRNRINRGSRNMSSWSQNADGTVIFSLRDLNAATLSEAVETSSKIGGGGGGDGDDGDGDGENNGTGQLSTTSTSSMTSNTTASTTSKKQGGGNKKAGGRRGRNRLFPASTSNSNHSNSKYSNGGGSGGAASLAGSSSSSSSQGESTVVRNNISTSNGGGKKTNGRPFNVAAGSSTNGNIRSGSYGRRSNHRYAGRDGGRGRGGGREGRGRGRGRGGRAGPPRRRRPLLGGGGDSSGKKKTSRDFDADDDDDVVVASKHCNKQYKPPAPTSTSIEFAAAPTLPSPAAAPLPPAAASVPAASAPFGMMMVSNQANNANNANNGSSIGSGLVGLDPSPAAAAAAAGGSSNSHASVVVVAVPFSPPEPANDSGGIGPNDSGSGMEVSSVTRTGSGAGSGSSGTKGAPSSSTTIFDAVTFHRDDDDVDDDDGPPPTTPSAFVHSTSMAVSDSVGGSGTSRSVGMIDHGVSVAGNGDGTVGRNVNGNDAAVQSPSNGDKFGNGGSGPGSNNKNRGGREGKGKGGKGYRKTPHWKKKKSAGDIADGSRRDRERDLADIAAEDEGRDDDDDDDDGNENVQIHSPPAAPVHIAAAGITGADIGIKSPSTAAASSTYLFSPSTSSTAATVGTVGTIGSIGSPTPPPGFENLSSSPHAAAAAAAASLDDNGDIGNTGIIGNMDAPITNVAASAGVSAGAGAGGSGTKLMLSRRLGSIDIRIEDDGGIATNEAGAELLSRLATAAAPAGAGGGSIVGSTAAIGTSYRTSASIGSPPIDIRIEDDGNIATNEVGAELLSRLTVAAAGAKAISNIGSAIASPGSVGGASAAVGSPIVLSTPPTPLEDMKPQSKTSSAANDDDDDDAGGNNIEAVVGEDAAAANLSSPPRLRLTRLALPYVEVSIGTTIGTKTIDADIDDDDEEEEVFDDENAAATDAAFKVAEEDVAEAARAEENDVGADGSVGTAETVMEFSSDNVDDIANKLGEVNINRESNEKGEKAESKAAPIVSANPGAAAVLTTPLASVGAPSGHSSSPGYAPGHSAEQQSYAATYHHPEQQQQQQIQSHYAPAYGYNPYSTAQMLPVEMNGTVYFVPAPVYGSAYGTYDSPYYGIQYAQHPAAQYAAAPSTPRRITPRSMNPNARAFQPPQNAKKGGRN